MKKRLLSLLLAVVMIVSLLPGSIFAVSLSDGTVLWSETYTTGQGHQFILTATAPVGYGFPDDARTAGKYYAGMTLKVDPIEDADYASVPSADGQWTVAVNDTGISGSAPIVGNDLVKVQYYDASLSDDTLTGTWVDSNVLTVPTATMIPDRTLTLSASDVTTDAAAADVTVKVETNVLARYANDVKVSLNGVDKYADLTSAKFAFVTFEDVPASTSAYTVTATAAAVSTLGADTYKTAVDATSINVNVTRRADGILAFTVKNGGTDLTSGASVKEYTKLTLNADVRYDSDNNGSITDADAAVTDGIVTYYADGQALATVPAGSSYTYELPEMTPVLSVAFSAKYWGSATFAPVATAADFTVALSSDTINGGTAAISASPALKVGTESTLSLTGNVVDSSGLGVAATNYTVQFYENKGDGIWTLDADGKVTPAEGYTYKAIVWPTGDYHYGAFELGPVGGSGIAAATTTTAVTAAAPTNVWQNKTAVAYTAKVMNGTNKAVGGSVNFYLVKDSVTTFYDTASLVDGEAVCSIVFPEAGSYKVKAVYSGTGAYGTSNNTTTDAVTVKSTTINATAAVAPVAVWALGANNTLNLTVTSGAGAPAYVEGTDYIVIWQQNDGSGWFEFARGGVSQTVKPMSNTWSYRAVLLPVGDYIAPANGIVSTVASVSGATLLATTTELSVDNATPFEDGTVTLTAVAKQGTNVLTGGNVLFTLPDATTRTVAIDSTGAATLTVPAPSYAAGSAGTKTYKAQYLGDGVLYAATAAPVSKTVTSKSVTVKAADAKIYKADDTAYTTAVGNASLKLKPITDLAGTALTYGTDFLTEWFVSEDGATWLSLGMGETKEVNPESNTWSYKAVVTPVGNYKLPYGGLLFTNTAGTLTATTTTLAKTAPTGDVYVGNTVTLTATVAPATTTGKVYFYDATTGMQLAVRDLSAGTAVYSFTATGETMNVYAEFAGTGTHKSSVSPTVTVTPETAEIKAAAALTVDPDVATLTVGTEYTLTIPAIQDKQTSTALALNTNYTVQWMSRNEDGSWVNIGSSANSITVKPTHDKAAYTAVIMPKYDAVLGSYYSAPVSGISMNTLTVGTKIASKVALTVEGGVTKAYEGSTVRLIATVTDTATPTPNLINGGSVQFKVKVPGSSTAVALSPEVAVVNGVATYDYVMPAWSATGSAYTFTAAYDGTDAYAASSDTTGKSVTDKSATLALKSDANTITVAPTGTPVVGAAYTLTAPAVYGKDNTSVELTLDRGSAGGQLHRFPYAVLHHQGRQRTCQSRPCESRPVRLRQDGYFGRRGFCRQRNLHRHSCYAEGNRCL